MAEEKWLLQRGTNRFYKFTDTLAKRKDMTEVTAESIKVRIEAKKRQVAEAKARLASKINGSSVPEDIRGGASDLAELNEELAETEKLIKDLDSEATPAEEKESENVEEENERIFNDLLEKDPEMIKIKAMESIGDIEDYLAAEYGVESSSLDGLDESEQLEFLREMAIEKRTSVLKES